MAQRWLELYVTPGAPKPQWAEAVAEDAHPWLKGALVPYYHADGNAFALAYTITPERAKQAGIETVIMETSLFAVSPMALHANSILKSRNRLLPRKLRILIQEY